MIVIDKRLGAPLIQAFIILKPSAVYFLARSEIKLPNSTINTSTTAPTMMLLVCWALLTQSAGMGVLVSKKYTGVGVVA